MHSFSAPLADSFITTTTTTTAWHTQCIARFTTVMDAHKSAREGACARNHNNKLRRQSQRARRNADNQRAGSRRRRRHHRRRLPQPHSYCIASELLTTMDPPGDNNMTETDVIIFALSLSLSLSLSRLLAPALYWPRLSILSSLLLSSTSSSHIPSSLCTCVIRTYTYVCICTSTGQVLARRRGQRALPAAAVPLRIDQRRTIRPNWLRPNDNPPHITAREG